MSKKEKVIETALDLFLQNSFTTVGVDRIILESGVAKMTFYKYFPSKEILTEDCLSATSERFKREITKEINKIEKNDYLKKVKAIYTCYVQCFKSKSFNGCIFQKAIYEILILYPSVITPNKNYKTWLFQTITYLLIQLNIPQP